MYSLEEIASQLGLTNHGGEYYGQHRNFWFVLGDHRDKTEDKVYIALRTKDQIQGEALQDEIRNTITHIDSVIVEDTVLIVYFITRSTVLDLDNNSIIEGINSLLTLCAQRNIVTPCIFCTENSPSAFYTIAGKTIPVCDACLEQVKEQKSKRKGTAVNYATGFAGAIIGGLIGSIVWILIGALGFYASLGGLAIAYAAYFGYRALGGKTTNGAIAVIAVAVICSVLFAEVFSVGWELAKYVKTEMGFELTVSETARLTFAVLSDGKDMGSFYFNIGLGLLFAAAGSAGILKKISRQSKDEDIQIAKI